jgi:hypothetical protein
VHYVPTSGERADCLRKPLAGSAFTQVRPGLKEISRSAFKELLRAAGLDPLAM